MNTIEQDTINSFNKEWEHYTDFGYDNNKTQFLKKTGLTRQDIQDKMVLDAGCGNGRFCVSAAELNAKKVIGIDMRQSTSKLNTRINNPKICFKQANIKNPPFETKSFDVIYSIGVLHHMQNPKQAFQKLVTLLKPGGIISINIYKKGTPLRELTENMIRSVTTRLSRKTLWYLCYIPSTIGKVLNLIPAWKKNGRWIMMDEVVCAYVMHMTPSHLSFFDWWSPKIASRHTMEEVKGWYVQAGLTNVKEVGTGSITLKGVKS